MTRPANDDGFISKNKILDSICMGLGGRAALEVVRVPQSRFNTAVTLYDGTSNFGFAPTAGGYKINFMIVHPSAVLPVVKHEIVKVFSPDENQSADAWKFQIRVYHDLFVLDQKVKGIYCHYDTTANT